MSKSVLKWCSKGVKNSNSDNEFSKKKDLACEF